MAPLSVSISASVSALVYLSLHIFGFLRQSCYAAQVGLKFVIACLTLLDNGVITISHHSQ